MATDDRPSSFQPDKPHPQTKGGGGFAVTHLVVAGAAAAMVIMVLAIWSPRFLNAFGGSTWIVTLGAGALTFAAVVAFAATRR